MKVSCLTATYGRYKFLCEAVTCFNNQDYLNRELIILNNHPTPIICDMPLVRVINEPGHQTLGDCRNRLLKEATGDYVRTWDDDDLYMPWAISQGVENINGAMVWKPEQSWGWRVDKDQMYLSGNTYEASWTSKIEFIKEHGYRPASGGNEHKDLSIALSNGGMVRGKVRPEEASYIYRWGSGLVRISGTLGKEGMTIVDRTNRWMDKNQDTGDGRPIEPVDLSPYWKRVQRAIDGLGMQEHQN